MLHGLALGFQMEWAWAAKDLHMFPTAFHVVTLCFDALFGLELCLLTTTYGKKYFDASPLGTLHLVDFVMVTFGLIEVLLVLSGAIDDRMSRVNWYRAVR